jgi:zinc transport system ATP-binding protein
MTAPLVEVQDVRFAYNGQPALLEVNLTVQPGDFMAMIGPNGGGKTTLLKLMLGLLEPQAGRVRLQGRPPREMSHRVGYMPQDVHVNTRFPVSALDVVLMGTLTPERMRIRYTRKDREAARRALARLGMEGYAGHRLGELSGGQRQRIFLSRALVTDPRILFLDEPTASIDTPGQADFYRLLKELNERVTIIIVSHDLMVISRYVKSVACVNRRLHLHHQPELTGEMLHMMYPCKADEVCPVELVAHGLPHRVFPPHEDP